MAAVDKKCYYSNTSKIILFDFYLDLATLWSMACLNLFHKEILEVANQKNLKKFIGYGGCVKFLMDNLLGKVNKK